MSSNPHTRALLVVHFNIIVYAMCYWISSPIVPYLIREFTQSTPAASSPSDDINSTTAQTTHNSSSSSSLSLELGAFQSLFNVVQLGGGLTVGFLQDKFSGATALSITQMGSAGVYLCLLLANSMAALYFSRVLTIAQQSMQVAQAVISKAAIVRAASQAHTAQQQHQQTHSPAQDEKMSGNGSRSRGIGSNNGNNGGVGVQEGQENKKGDQRAVALGQLSLSYSIGMIIGSSASGPLSTHFGNTFTLAVAVGLSLSVLPLNRIFLHHLTDDDVTTPSTSSATTAKSTVTGSSTDGRADTTTTTTSTFTTAGEVSSQNYFTLAYNARAELLFLLFVFSTRALMQPITSVLLLESFQWPQHSMGTLLAVFAVMALLGNVAVLPLLVKFFSSYYYTAGDSHSCKVNGEKAEARIIQCCVLSLGGVFATLAVLRPEGADGAWVFVGMMLIMSLVSGMLYTLTTSYLSRTADGGAQGKVIAMSHATRSAVGIIFPLVGSGLYDAGGLRLVAGVTSSLFIVAFVLTLFSRSNVASSTTGTGTAKKKKE